MGKLSYLSTVNYAEINICCILIILALYIITRAYMSKVGKSVTPLITMAGASFAAYMAIDAAIAIARYKGVMTDVSIELWSSIMNSMLIIGAASWLIYVCQKSDYKFANKLVYKILMFVPAAVVIILLFASFGTKISDLAFEQSNYAYFILASVLALFSAMRKWGEKKIHLLTLALCSLPVVLFTEVGNLFNINSDPVGYLTACMILFYYEIIGMAVIHSRDERSISVMKEQIKAQDREHRDMAMFESLSTDFSSIMYVAITGRNEDDITEPFAMNDPLIRKIPGWFEEKSFYGRLKLLTEHAVQIEEREDFKEKVSRDRIIESILKGSVYYVNFRTVIDGEWHYYLLKFTPNTTADGKLQGIVVGIKCVDSEVESRLELQRMEEEQIAIKAFTNLFIEYYISAYYVNMKDASYVPYKRSSEIEDKYGKYLDYSESINKYIEESVHEADRDMMRANASFEYIKERMKTTDEFSVIYRDIMHSDVRYYKMQIIKGHDDNHVAQGFTDITKEIEKELKVQQMLEEANQSKTTFLFNMSHDIRTPMNAIIGFTDLAKKHVDNQKKVEDYLGKIEMSGQHLLQLINEVLDMSRIESGKVHTELKPINLLNSFSVLYTVCRENADEKGVALEWITKGISHPLIESDELHVNQVLMNVISNAVKYTLEGGKVVCTTQELASDRDGYAKFLFKIEDNGIGMSAEFLEHIFDSFSREENSTVSGIQGTGLGMSIVKRLVDLLGGEINITSEAGVGTCVDIIFDFKIQGAQESGEGAVAETKKIDLTGSKVLLVEDNELNREIATEMLMDEGFIIEGAENGQEAVNAVKEKGVGYYDFILMDIQMPVMNGFEATAAIRALKGGSDLVIIALSANAFEEDRQRSLVAGMNDHIAKPIDIGKLIEAMAKLK